MAHNGKADQVNSRQEQSSTGSEVLKLLGELQQQANAGSAGDEIFVRLRQAAEAAEREREELARREQAARAEAAATRTEADKAVKALAESEQRYRYMGETIPFGVWWCNPKGEAEYVSPSFCELLDMSLEEQQKFGWTQRLVPEDVEPMMKHWMYCCETGTPWDHEHRIIDRYGKINTVLSRGLPVRNEMGKIIAWVGVNLDITARKQTELQLQEAKDALEQALHIKDQFLANISHEWRTPLTLILGPVRQLLAADNLSDQQRRDLAVVQRNAGTLLKIVNDLLDLSRLDAGRMRAEYAEADLAWLARFVASHFESVAAERGITFTVEIPESLTGQADPEKIQRVLFNLLSNAFKFTPAQGVVRFSLKSEDGNAIFSVEDTGPGIPEDMRETIFERFRQVDSSATRRYGGTGLGLAIVKEFVDLHRGWVGAAEAAGGGARLTARISLTAPEGVEVKEAGPFANEDAARAAVAELQHPPAPAAVPRDKFPSPDAPLVLIVEDNPEMNAFVAQALGEHYRVGTAQDGQEGLEKALELGPDLIISDIMMPHLSGEDLVREVRRRRELDDVPILLLTAKADERLRVKLLSDGAQDCLVKPFVTEELVARAAGLIARKRKAEAQLRESYALLRAVTEGVADAIFVKDDQSRYRMINTAGAWRLGKTVGEVIGQDDQTLLGVEAGARILADDQKIMGEQRTLTFEEIRWVDGTTRTYLTTQGPHLDHEGKVIGVLGIAHDITQRKQAEEEIQKLNAELELRVEQRTAELATANRELEAFSYTVSHDLRAPLRHVMTFVELLQQDIGASLDEQSRGFMQIISDSSRRMGALIDDLLALSRLSRSPISKTNVYLEQLVAEVRQELAADANGRAIEWVIGPLPEVRGDPTLLRSVLVNLLSNAIKYTRKKDPALIEVGAEEHGREVVCFVRDNGAGFDMKFVDKLFGVFQRLHPSEAFEGTGIGLASVRRIIERHGGRVWAEGAVERGATFYFTLPRGK